MVQENYTHKKWIDVPKLLDNANTADSLLNLCSRFGYEFKAKGNDYQCVDSEGLRIYKNRRSDKWLIKNHSLKTDVPDGGIFQLAEHFLNLRTKGDYQALRTVCRLIADCSGQRLEYLELDNNTPLPKPGKQKKPIRREFLPNNGGTTNQSYLPKFAPWSSSVGKSTATYFNKFGVKKGTLLNYRIEPLECLKTPDGKRIAHQFNADDFAFGYAPDGIGGNIKYKRPKSPAKGRKEGYIQSTGNYVFGINQLPDDCNDKILIIAAGEKDCLVINQHLNDLGIYSICFASESVNLDYKFIKSLKTKFSGNVFTLFDNDKAGLESAIKARNRNNLSAIKIGNYVNNDKYKGEGFNHNFKEIEFKINRKKTTKTSINSVLNDASDVVYHLGKNELIRIAKTEISKVWGRRINIIPRRGYVSEVLKGINTENHKLSFITGLGKTSYILHLEGCKVILCPTTTLVDNIAGDESYKDLDVFKFNSKIEQVGKLKGIDHVKDLPKIIVTTYASFPKLDRILSCFTGYLDLIVDEWQTLILGSNKGFMYEDNRYIINRMKMYKSVRLLSATPVYSCVADLQKMPEIKNDALPTKKELFLYDCKNTIKSAAGLIIDSKEAKRMPVFLMDKKNEAKELGTILNLIDDNNFLAINADTKNLPVQSKILATGYFPKNFSGAGFTSVAKAGNNFKDEYHYDMYIIGSFHIADIIQFVGRFRNALSVKIHILRGAKRENQDIKYFDFDSAALDIEKDALARCTSYNRKGEIKERQQIRELNSDNRIQDLGIQIDDKGKYYPCDILRSNLVNNKFQQATYSSDYLLVKELGKANIIGYTLEDGKIVPNQPIIKKDNQITADQLDRIKENKSNVKTKKEDEFKKLIEQIKVQPFKIRYCTNISRNIQSTATQKDASKKFLALSKELKTPTDVITLLEEIGTTRGKYTRQLAKIDIARLYQDSGYMESERRLSLLMKLIYKEFKIGAYTSEEIQNKLIGVFQKFDGYKSVKLVSTNEKDYKKSINIIRMFFDAKSAKHLDGIRGKNGYILSKPIIYKALLPNNKAQNIDYQYNRVLKMLPF